MRKNIHRVLSFFLAVLLLLSPVGGPAFAAATTGRAEKAESEQKAGKSVFAAEDFTYKDVPIPGTEDEEGYPDVVFSVTGLAPSGKKKLGQSKSLTLPDHDPKGRKPLWVEDDAFANLGLEEVTIPGNYTHIQFRAFQNNKIKTVHFTKGLKYVNDQAFENNQITDLTLPEGFLYPAKGAFENNRLTKLRLPSTCKGVGPQAFRRNRIESLRFEKNLVNIYDKAFADNRLTQVNLPATVGTLRISPDAFDGNSGKTDPANKGQKKVLLFTPGKNNPKKIKDGNHFVVDHVGVRNYYEAEDFTYERQDVKFASGKTENLNLITGFSDTGKDKQKQYKDLVLPDTDEAGMPVDGVAHNAFMGKMSQPLIQSLEIPEGLRYIGTMAFGFAGIQGDLTLPDTIEEVGSAAFFRNGITDLTLSKKMTRLMVASFRGNKISKLNIPGALEEIQRLALAENRLEELQIPESLKKIGAEALKINTGKEEYEGKVVLRTPSGKNPSGLVDRENYLVDPRAAEKKPTLDYSTWTREDFRYKGQTVTGFSAQGQQKVKKNKKLVVPAQTPEGKPVLKIGMDAFRNLNKGYDLVHVTLPDTVQEIGDYAFQFNELKEFTLPRDLVRLGMGVLMDSQTEKLTFNKKLKFIDQACFFLCPLKEVTLPASVEVIMNAAFRNCSLEKVTFGGKQLRRIESMAFADNKLMALELPEGLEKIGSQAFANSKQGVGNQLKELNVPASLKELGFQAFLGNPGVEDYRGAVVIHTPSGKNPQKLQDDAGKTFVIDLEKSATKAEKDHFAQVLAQVEKEASATVPASFADFLAGEIREAKQVQKQERNSQSQIFSMIQRLEFIQNRLPLAQQMARKEALEKQGKKESASWKKVEAAYQAAKKYLMVINITPEKVQQLTRDLRLALDQRNPLSPDHDLAGATAYEGLARMPKTHYITPYMVKVIVWVKDGKILYVIDNGTETDDPKEEEKHNEGYYESAKPLLLTYVGKTVKEVLAAEGSDDLGIDAVSGATNSSQAIHRAIVNALKKVPASQPAPAPQPEPQPQPTPKPQPQPGPEPGSGSLRIKEEDIPHYTKGVLSTWNRSQGGDLHFEATLDYDQFHWVKVDGRTLTSSEYAMSRGSIKLQLKESFLKTLKPGRHTINICAGNWSKETYFFVAAGSSRGLKAAGGTGNKACTSKMGLKKHDHNGSAPKTGDPGMISSLGVALLAGATFFGLMTKDRKRK